MVYTTVQITCEADSCIHILPLRLSSADPSPEKPLKRKKSEQNTQ